MPISRRTIIKMLPVTAISLVASPKPTSIHANPTKNSPLTRQYQGENLSEWEIALGDALYARSGEPPVTIDDIETIHLDANSELRANIDRRIIMAHNITFKRFVDDEAFQFIHTCGYKFRLPYIPQQDENSEFNAESLEGGIFIWDGSDTRLDYGIAFQWGLNPWNEFGFIRTWTDDSPEGKWTNVGQLIPDTEWHEVEMIVNYQRKTTALIIDGKQYLTRLTGVTKPSNWGTETAARLQAEIVSIYPEPSGMQAMHKAEFKDWYWIWEPHNTCSVFLPTIISS